MKFQWTLVVGLLFAIIISIFAVLNVDAVKVNYVFGETQLPLVLIILFSTLLGVIIGSLFLTFRTIQMNKQIKDIQKNLTIKEQTIANQQNEIAGLQKINGPIVEQPDQSLFESTNIE